MEEIHVRHPDRDDHDWQEKTHRFEGTSARVFPAAVRYSFRPSDIILRQSRE